MNNTNKRFRQRISKLVLCFLLAASSLKAQQENQWLLSKVLDNTTGLLQNSITSLYFDSRTGFLWMTTESGLARYDGLTPFIFDKRLLPGMKTVRMATILPTNKEGIVAMDRNGMLYKMTGATVSEFKGDSIKDPSYLNGFKGNFVSVNFANELMSKLSVAEKDTAGKYDLYQAPLSTVWVNDSMWLSYTPTFLKLFKYKKEIARWTKKTSEFPSLIRSGIFVYALNDNGNGYKVDAQKMICQKVSCLDTAFLSGKPKLFYDQLNNQPFMLNDNKLYRVEFYNNNIAARYIADLPDLPENIISILIHPTNKTIFVGSQLSGLFIYTKNPFRTYKAEGSSRIIGKIYTPRNNIYATVIPDPDHALTSTSVLFNLKTGTYSFSPFTIGRQQTLLSDNQKNLWYAYGDTLFRVKYGSGTPDKKILLTLKKNVSRTMLNFLQVVFQSITGRIWVSTGEYLGYIENDKLVEYISFPNVNESSLVYIAETTKGELLASNASGLYYIDTLERKAILIPQVTTRDIRSVYIDSENYCWIATYGNGIFVYDLTNKKFYQLPLDHNGYLLFGHIFCPDGAGNFLVPTNRGLFKINKKHLLETTRHPGSKLFYQYFDIKSGLETNEFNGGCQPAFNRLNNGDILLPSLSGLVRVNTSELPSPRNYPIFIDKIETEKQSYIKINKDHHFDANERNQTWNISFAQWDQAYSPGLSYKFDNDTEWKYLPEGKREIRLTDLAGGRHILNIRFQAGFLPGEVSSLTIPFSINKRYYEQPWFWLLSFLLFISFFYFVVRLQTINLNKKNIVLEKNVNEKTKELLEKNEQLATTLLDLENTITELNAAFTILEKSNLFMSRLIGVLGHDVLIPLQYIAKVSAQLKVYSEKLSKQTTLESLSEISTTSSQLQVFGESLVHWIKLQTSEYNPVMEKFQVSKTVNEIIDFHQLLLVEKGNIICNDVPPDLFFAQDATLVKIILQNLLKNANKFTSEGRITISATITQEEFLVIRIQDNGKGMTQDKVVSLNNLQPIISSEGTNMETGWGMGYVLIIDLLKISKGKLYVESKENQGSLVIVELPPVK